LHWSPSVLKQSRRLLQILSRACVQNDKQDAGFIAGMNRAYRELRVFTDRET
jgi:hypothetical protein